MSRAADGAHDTRSAAAWRRPVLGLDTSGLLATVALLEGDPAAGPDRLLELSAAAGSHASVTLHVLVEAVLAQAGLRAAELALVAAVRGPGSFTGLRVGLAAAAGLGFAAGVPTAGVPTTDAVVAQVARTGSHLVVVDGGQGRVFTAEHEARSTGEVVTLRAAEDASIEEACAQARAFRGFAWLRGRPPRAAELLEAGCVAHEQALAGACARLAASGAGGILEPLYGRPPAIRPGPALRAPSDVGP